MEPNEELYREIILDHNQHPRNFGPLPNATHEASGINEICGDQLTIRAVLDEDQIADIKFEAEGCALCKASASLMTCKIKGRSIANAETQSKKIENLLLAEHDPDASTLDQLGDTAALIGVRQYPPRIKCVLLAWEVLRKALG